MDGNAVLWVHVREALVGVDDELLRTWYQAADHEPARTVPPLVFEDLSCGHVADGDIDSGEQEVALELDVEAGVVLLGDLKALSEDLDVELPLVDVRWQPRLDMAPAKSGVLVERERATG